MSDFPRILLVHPGASVATADVYEGLREGLDALQVSVEAWDLSARITAHGAYLRFMERRLAKKPDPKDRFKVTSGAVLYRCGEELVSRALRVRPDWVVVVSGMYLHPDAYVLLRRAGLRVAVVLTESPYDLASESKVIPWCQVTTVNERTLVPVLEHLTKRPAAAELVGQPRPKITYLPWGYRHEHFCPTPASTADDSLPHVDESTPLPKAHDVIFVGTAFQNRIELLQQVDWTGINLGLYGNWRLVPPRSKLRPYIESAELLSAQTHAHYRAARVAINIHRGTQGFDRKSMAIGYAESMNLRCYELAAAGVPFVSDERAELRDIFGDLVPIFTDARSLRACLDQLLCENESARAARIAALREAIRPHDWTARAHLLLTALSRSSEQAPATPTARR